MSSSNKSVDMIVSILSVWLCLPSASLNFCIYDTTYTCKFCTTFFLLTFFGASFRAIDPCVSRLFCPSVLWHCVLDYAACKIVPEMNDYVSGGMSNVAHSLSRSSLLRSWLIDSK